MRRPAGTQAPGRPLRPPPARDAEPRRLQPRPQDRARPGRPAFPPRNVQPARRVAQRRRAEPAHAGQAAAGRAERDAPRRAVEPPRHRGHRMARIVPGRERRGHAAGQPRPLLPRPRDQPHPGTLPGHRRQLHGQFLRLLDAEGRAAAGPAADLREAADRDREGQGLHPPQPLRPEAPAGRRPPQEARPHRVGRRAAGDRPAADGLSARLAERRYRGPRRRAGQGLRAAVVLRRRSADHPRRAVGTDRSQRLRQVDLAALPAGRRAARCRQPCRSARA